MSTPPSTPGSSTPPTSVSSPPPAAPHNCPHCQRAIPTNAVLGACPHCLLAAGLASEPAAPNNSAPPPTVAELAPEFPQLEILELLGRGGMGAVYKARQRSLDRHVALKLLRPGLDADPSFSERFTREARALAQLNHPGIVTLYEFGRTPGGLFFILMEFVDGLNLRQLLAADRLAPREALAIVPPLCDALQYAHDRGLVHRDIKPENILIDRLGRIKIADFGLAKLAATNLSDTQSPSSSGIGHWSLVTDHSGLTEHGKVMGTPEYMAPEQRAHPDQVDHRADIYALGVVFYQMLTGELPDAQQLQPPSHRVQLDIRLDEIVLRALSANPALRYAAVSEFKTQLETVASTSSPAPPPPGAPTAPSAPSASDSSAHLQNPVPKNSAPPSLRVSAIHRPRLKFWLLRVAPLSLIVLLLLRTFVIAPYIIAGSSIEPDIPAGSWAYVYKLPHRFWPGDIIAYRVPEATYVARVTAIGPVNGQLTITRNNLAPTPIPISTVIGKVVFNTRSTRDTPPQEIPPKNPSSVSDDTAQPSPLPNSEPADLRAARAALAEAQLRYLDPHPQIKTLRLRIEELSRLTREEPSITQDLRDAKVALAEADLRYLKNHPAFQAAEARVRALEQTTQEKPPASTPPPPQSQTVVSDPAREILILILAQARRSATEAQGKFDAGLSQDSELQAAKDHVAILEAELAGDATQVLRVKLAAAERRVKYIQERFHVGLGTRAELDAAETQAAVLKLELKGRTSR